MLRAGPPGSRTTQSPAPRRGRICRELGPVRRSLTASSNASFADEVQSVVGKVRSSLAPPFFTDQTSAPSHLLSSSDNSGGYWTCVVSVSQSTRICGQSLGIWQAESLHPPILVNGMMHREGASFMQMLVIEFTKREARHVAGLSHRGFCRLRPARSFTP